MGGKKLRGGGGWNQPSPVSAWEICAFKKNFFFFLFKK